MRTTAAEDAEDGDEDDCDRQCRLSSDVEVGLGAACCWTMVVHNFLNLVASNWNSELTGNSQFALAQNLKSLKQFLKSWNKNVFGDLRLQVLSAEKKVLELQELLDASPTDSLHLSLAEANRRSCNFITTTHSAYQILWALKQTFLVSTCWCLCFFTRVYLMFLHECHNKVLTSEIPMWFRPSKYYPNAKSQVHLHEMLKHVKILAWIDRYIGIVEFAGIIVWLLHQVCTIDL
ncbi:hypothetical protein AAC387_Pa04g0926 [Persea americana]